MPPDFSGFVRGSNRTATALTPCPSLACGPGELGQKPQAHRGRAENDGPRNDACGTGGSAKMAQKRVLRQPQRRDIQGRVSLERRRGAGPRLFDNVPVTVALGGPVALSTSAHQPAPPVFLLPAKPRRVATIGNWKSEDLLTNSLRSCVGKNEIGARQVLDGPAEPCQLA